MRDKRASRDELVSVFHGDSFGLKLYADGLGWTSPWPSQQVSSEDLLFCLPVTYCSQRTPISRLGIRHLQHAGVAAALHFLFKQGGELGELGRVLGLLRELRAGVAGFMRVAVKGCLGCSSGR